MKIVDVAEFYADQGGGVKTYINQKLTAGAEAGHEIVVIAPGPRDHVEERNGGKIIWIGGPPMPFDPRYRVLWSQAKVHAALDRERPDVVEGSSPWSGGWFAARWRGDAVKTFVFHQDPVAVFPQTFWGHRFGADRVDRAFGWYWAYLRRLSRNFDATIVAGQWLATKLSRFEVQHPIAVPFGIDKQLFSPRRREEAVRRGLLSSCNRGPEASLLVAISRFHPEKRLPMLFEAFEKASARRPMGLVVFGGGPLQKRIERLAEAVDGIHLAGYNADRPSLATALASADAFLHGSSAETYGLVVAEAICSGLPVVVPRVGGAADLAAPEYAETYRPGDVDACAAAIELMLMRAPDGLRAGCARAAAQQIGTMADHFDGLFDVYDQLLARRRERRGPIARASAR